MIMSHGYDAVYAASVKQYGSAAVNAYLSANGISKGSVQQASGVPTVAQAKQMIKEQGFDKVYADAVAQYGKSAVDAYIKANGI